MNKKLSVCQQWVQTALHPAKAQPEVSRDRLFPFSHRQSCILSSLLIFEPLDIEEILIIRRETKEKHQKGDGACDA